MGIHVYLETWARQGLALTLQMMVELQVTVWRLSVQMDLALMIFILFSVTNNIYGVSLTQHVMMWLLRLLFLTQQEVLMISSRVSCSPTVVHSGKEMVSMLVLKELMTQY